MNVEPTTCARCEAENRPGSDHCWKCFAPLRETDLRPAASGDVATPGVVFPVVTEQPVEHRPAVRPVRTTQYPVRTTAGTWQQPRATKSATGSFPRLIARVILVGALGVGAWFGYGLAVGFLKPDFPAEIAGNPRSLDQDAGGLVSSMHRWADPLGIRLEVETYGSAVQSTDAAFALAKMDGWSGRFSAIELLASLSSGEAMNKISPGYVREELAGGDRYLCLTGLDHLTRCLWHAGTGEVFVVTGGSSRSYADVLSFTQAAHGAT